MSVQPTKPKITVKVTVIFPISVEGPFHAQESRETNVSDVLVVAMAHFKVSQDPEYEYYLTHDSRRLAGETPLGEIAGEHEAVKFTLVKELIQGLS